jgi:RND family efflux transporter MFP subunit
VAQANWDAVQQTVHARAPIAGMITDINVRELQKVNAGDYLFTISQLNKLHGRIWVSEDDINSVPKNAEVLFRWNNIQKAGKITSLALSMNRDSNAFAADVEIDNADYAVRSGVTGRAVLVIYRNNKAIVVPRSVVQKDSEGQSYVYVAEGNVAVRKDVTISNESQLDYEIKDGLNIGDMLIVQGLIHVQSNSKINIQ